MRVRETHGSRRTDRDIVGKGEMKNEETDFIANVLWLFSSLLGLQTGRR